MLENGSTYKLKGYAGTVAPITTSGSDPISPVLVSDESSAEKEKLFKYSEIDTHAALQSVALQTFLTRSYLDGINQVMTGEAGINVFIIEAAPPNANGEECWYIKVQTDSEKGDWYMTLKDNSPGSQAIFVQEKEPDTKKKWVFVKVPTTAFFSSRRYDNPGVDSKTKNP